MGCCDPNTNITEQQRFGFVEGTPCEAITVDLLELYKRKIDCYLLYKLWVNIQSTKEELEGAQTYLQNFIDQKVADPSDCTGVESLYIVRALVDKIIRVGACL
jgi:hypothetical protein